jgi:hypothetical protein
MEASRDYSGRALAGRFQVSLVLRPGRHSPITGFATPVRGDERRAMNPKTKSRADGGSSSAAKSPSGRSDMQQLIASNFCVKHARNGAASGEVAHGGKTSEKPNFFPLSISDTGTAQQVKISKLTVHPAIAEFPGLGEGEFTEGKGAAKRSYRGDFDRLKADIKRTGRILVPLLVDPQHRVVDGRHRLRIAKELDFETVPVVRVNGDALEVALASALTGRQLTKSGIAWILFEHHPELRDESRKLAGLKRGSEEGEETGCTFTSLANQYGIPRQYFSGIAVMAKEFSEPQWAEARGLVLFKEFSIGEAYRAVKTAVATRHKKRSDPKWDKLLLESMAVEVPERLKCWEKLPRDQQDAHFAEVRKKMKQWPGSYALRLSATIQEFFSDQSC